MPDQTIIKFTSDPGDMADATVEIAAVMFAEDEANKAMHALHPHSHDPAFHAGYAFGVAAVLSRLAEGRFELEVIPTKPRR